MFYFNRLVYDAHKSAHCPLFWWIFITLSWGESRRVDWHEALIIESFGLVPNSNLHRIKGLAPRVRMRGAGEGGRDEKQLGVLMMALAQGRENNKLFVYSYFN